MRAAVFRKPGLIEVAERPDPAIVEPTDAVVRGTAPATSASEQATRRRRNR